MDMMWMIKENARNNKTTVMIIVMLTRVVKSQIKTAQAVLKCAKSVQQGITWTVRIINARRYLKTVKKWIQAQENVLNVNLASD